MCQARVHANETHEMCGKGKTCMLIQAKCMGEVRVNHDAHGSRLSFRVYTHALNVRTFYVIDLSCTCRLCCKYFQKHVELCSCLTRVYSQV